ncbi:unnamed protein product [Rodentolepis nana]|uniref:Uncharacterized protein n=1 Tax=Rodentolepis nana TaxID=102285 RepID=A0A3P7V9C7_RODNA|nr:unnamed protein product [Rodentolepis nana]
MKRKRDALEHLEDKHYRVFWSKHLEEAKRKRDALRNTADQCKRDALRNTADQTGRDALCNTADQTGRRDALRNTADQPGRTEDVKAWRRQDALRKTADQTGRTRTNLETTISCPKASHLTSKTDVLRQVHLKYQLNRTSFNKFISNISYYGLPSTTSSQISTMKLTSTSSSRISTIKLPSTSSQIAIKVIANALRPKKESICLKSNCQTQERTNTLKQQIAPQTPK